MPEKKPTLSLLDGATPPPATREVIEHKRKHERRQSEEARGGGRRRPPSYRRGKLPEAVEQRAREPPVQFTLCYLSHHRPQARFSSDARAACPQAVRWSSVTEDKKKNIYQSCAVEDKIIMIKKKKCWGAWGGGSHYTYRFIVCTGVTLR